MFLLILNILFLNNRQTSPDELPDGQLIARYQKKQDPNDLGVLYQRYTHLVFGVCMKYLKNEADAQDAVMDIFEELVVKLQQYEVANFKSWLYSLAKNHCLMKLRKGQSVLKQIDGYEKFAAEFMELEDELHLFSENGMGIDEKIALAMEQLKEEQKQCVKLFFFDQKSYKEIEEVTGFSNKEVKSHLQNGKRNLKQLLTQTHE